MAHLEKQGIDQARQQLQAIGQYIGLVGIDLKVKSGRRREVIRHLQETLAHGIIAHERPQRLKQLSMRKALH